MQAPKPAPVSGAMQQLVDHYGGRQAAADALGVTRETIRLWLIRGIPLERAIEIERLGVITAEQVLHEARARLAA